MNKKKGYATGFKWGKREHKFEKRTTKLLVVGIILLGAGIYLEYWEYWRQTKYLFFAVFIIFVVCWLFRLISAYCHIREKHYMDKLRFNR